MRRLLPLALAAAACRGTTPADPPDAVVGADATVQVFDDEHVYFGDPNRRTVDVTARFPDPGQRFASVVLHLGLACPAGGCDWWDRLGRISLVDGDREIELARFITPYRVGGDFSVDVTDLQRLLEGEQTVRVFIDTWVGPGHANGAGWLVDARFEFAGGVAEPEPFAVLPLWSPEGVVYGDPARPTARQATVEVPADAAAARVRALVTGHGQGNADNCAEFCAVDHTLDAAGDGETIELWRDDCATSAVPGQQGTWQYPRAGWCPGAMVAPWAPEVAVTAGPLAVGWDVEAYVNTCRPDAEECTGCVLGTGCDYDGGAHTEPRWELSAVLILLR